MNENTTVYIEYTTAEGVEGAATIAKDQLPVFLRDMCAAGVVITKVNTETTPRSIMPAWLKTKWLEALRSGKYLQAREYLRGPSIDDPTRQGNCCLGVLQLVAGDKDVECQNLVAGLPSKAPLSLPTSYWLTNRGIIFKSQDGESSRTPYLPSLRRRADEANDQGMTFAAIAAAIEKDIYGV